MLSSPPSQRARSPVERRKKNGGASSPTSGRVVYRLVTNATSPRRRNDVRGSVQVAEYHSDLNKENKNMCGEESRMIQREAPLRLGRRGGVWGGSGAFV